MKKNTNFKCYAFIPARSGSKRVKDKNIKKLGKHPLMAYSIVAALESNIFDKVICSTDDIEYAEIAKYYGAEVPFLRSQKIAKDNSSDIEWVKELLEFINNQQVDCDVFSILRPTSPFRSKYTIQKAYNLFLKEMPDSLRAVELCSQHPGKMWQIQSNRMLPLLPFSKNNVPWHSSQYASLPAVFVQNASLEIAWSKTVMMKDSISGSDIMPFYTEELEGFDINNNEDWILAEHYISQNPQLLNTINIKPYSKK